MELVTRQGFKVVGIRVVADWEGLWVEVPRAWAAFIERHEEIGRRAGGGFIDLSQGEKGGEYTQLICAEVEEFGEIPAGMVGLEVPTGRYIRHRHEGSVQEIAASFGEMYAWAREHGVAAGAFKVDQGYTKDGREQGHDLYVGVASS